MAKADPMAPITRLPNLAFVDEDNNNYRALYSPILSQEEVIAVPVTEDLPGAIVFNKDTEELETYTAAGFWLPILTAESDITVNSITVTGLADLYSITSHDISNSTLITTLGLLVSGDTQINGHAVINTSLVVNGTANFTSGGVTGSFGVNGSLTAGNLGTTGTLTVDGDTELQDTVITGNLEVTGTALIDDYSGDVMDVNDFQARTAQVEDLLYGLTNLGGGAPITVTLGTGAGTGATFSIEGSATAGRFTLNTGSSPAAAQIVATFTLNPSLAPLMTGVAGMTTKAGNSAAGLFEAASGTYINVGSGNVAAFMAVNSTALTASTTYVWNYILVGNILGH